MSRVSKTQAEAIASRLIEIKHNLNRDLDELINSLNTNGKVRPPRNYDVPAPDPEVVAREWGVDLTDPEGEVPEWVRQKFGHHMEAK